MSGRDPVFDSGREHCIMRPGKNSGSSSSNSYPVLPRTTELLPRLLIGGLAYRDTNPTVATERYLANTITMSVDRNTQQAAEDVEMLGRLTRGMKRKAEDTVKGTKAAPKSPPTGKGNGLATSNTSLDSVIMLSKLGLDHAKIKFSGDLGFDSQMCRLFYAKGFWSR
ncbi:hypothetical protein K438DRAFT_1769276 [Mycena galopus ATCC 62051]|nr:hypothetical protein K438DRAFT_1769276 [Mycena galopus ATCC 62051]